MGSAFSQFAIWLTVACSGLCATLGSSSCQAEGPSGWIGEVSVQMDGSADPPGDVVAFHLQLRGEPAGAKVELMAYAVDAQGNAQQVAAASERLRGANGQFSIEKILTAAQAQGGEQIRLTVPYAALQLPQGEHRLGYEVRVMRGEELLVASASELTSVTITAEARTLRHQVQTVETLGQSRETQSFMLGGKDAGRGGPPSKQSAEIQRPTVRLQKVEKEVTVQIPGGFARRSLLAEPSGEIDLRGKDRLLLPHVQLADLRSAENRTIQFCTNRQYTTATPQSLQFTANLSPQLTYGKAIVDVPVRFHRKGNLEQASWWGASKEAIFSVNSLAVIPLDELQSCLGPNDVLVFVHGFNNPFEDVLLQCGQLAYDLEFGGKVILFSWPSAGSVTSYDADAAMSAQSSKAFAELLKNLLALRAAQPESKRGKIHLMAHSMGNRILLHGLNELFADSQPNSAAPAFDQIIMAAPDVGAAQFNNLVDQVIKNCRQASYYFCRQDSALKISQNINKYEPVGLYPYFQAGLVTISADNANSSFLGHSYFAGSVEMLADLELLIGQGMGPDSRMPPLVGREKVFGHEYWVFPPRATAMPRATAAN